MGMGSGRLKYLVAAFQIKIRVIAYNVSGVVQCGYNSNSIVLSALHNAGVVR